MSHEKLTIDLKKVDQPSPFIDSRESAIEELYNTAKTDRLEFWNQQAQKIHWQSPWNTTLEWNRPYSKWFIDGKLNAAENCLDIHLEKNSDKTAQTATLTGTARNLLGNKKQLTFKEVVEGDAIYYLAQIDYSNEEIYRFDIEINQNGKVQTLKFQQKFYVD